MTNTEVDRWIALRRRLHEEPELSLCEEKTAERVVEALAPLGVPIRRGVGGHGLLVDIEGERPGPTLAYRADMDALPIEEANDIPHRSRVKGVMHACGHDVHTAIAAGLASRLFARRSELCGRVRFIFQPAEEATAPAGQLIGAEAMVRDGALEDVDAIVAVHCLPSLEVGHFGHVPGAVFANSDVFQIVLTGRGTHAAYPHDGIDAVQMAAALVPQLLSIPSHLTNALDPCVVSVGRLEAGTANNIIAHEAHLGGIIRTFDETCRERATSAVRRMAEHVAKAFGGEAAVELRLGARAVLNHPALEARFIHALSGSAGGQAIVRERPHLGAEDFSAFSSRIPGCYVFLGVGNRARGLTHHFHTPRFDVDERCIPFGIEHLANALIELGRGGAVLAGPHGR